MDDFFVEKQQNDFFGQQQDFQDPNTTYFNIDFESGDDKGSSFEGKEKIIDDTSESENAKTIDCQQKQLQVFKKGLFCYKQVSTNKIQIENKSLKKQLIQAKIGNKSQTKQLTINFKTLLCSFLAQIQPEVSLTLKQKQLIDQFYKSQKSLASFRQLYGVKQKQKQKISVEDREKLVQEEDQDKTIITELADRIRKFCLDKMTETKVIQKIFKSTKMNLQNKLIQIKYLQVLRKGCIQPEHLYSWKNE